MYYVYGGFLKWWYPQNPSKSPKCFFFGCFIMEKPPIKGWISWNGAFFGGEGFGSPRWGPWIPGIPGIGDQLDSHQAATDNHKHLTFIPLPNGAKWCNVGKEMSFLPPVLLGMVSLYHTFFKMVMTGGWCKWHCFHHIRQWYQNAIVEMWRDAWRDVVFGAIGITRNSRWKPPICWCKNPWLSTSFKLKNPKFSLKPIHWWIAHDSDKSDDSIGFTTCDPDADAQRTLGSGQLVKNNEI
jgi:hypothetical protein